MWLSSMLYRSRIDQRLPGPRLTDRLVHRLMFEDQTHRPFSHFQAGPLAVSDRPVDTGLLPTAVQPGEFD